MKLRTSFFNPAAFKKDITRFAPAWVLYGVVLFMVLSVCLIDSSEYYRATSFAASLSFMASLNLCYGLLNGQLLFGDLFNARHCNALHAMHLRRECWYFTHITAGLLFSLVPNLVLTLIAIPMLGSGWQVALWWLLASSLQYLFFFGLAVFSALCVGSRFAMVLVYGIINFFSLIVYWFYNTLYEPLLTGVRVDEELFTQFCPVWIMCSSNNLVEIIGREGGYTTAIQSVIPSGDWGYLALCAAIGAGLLALALVIYRRRKLESAGDFMSVRVLEPVFLVLYTMSMAAFFQLFNELFGGEEYLFLAIGLAVGFFTGRMLLMRTTRVFQPRALLGYAVFVAVFVASMVVTWLDPIGITRHIPAADDIAKITLAPSYKYHGGDSIPVLTSDEDVDAVRRLHQLILDGETVAPEAEPPADGSYTREYAIDITILYTLENGTTVERHYNVDTQSPAGLLAGTFFTRPEYILGEDADTIVSRLSHVYYSDYANEIYGTINPVENRKLAEGLIHAIEADCLAGNMAQNSGYHINEDAAGIIELEYLQENGVYTYRYLEIHSCAKNTAAYITANILPFLETQ